LYMAARKRADSRDKGRRQQVREGRTKRDTFSAVDIGLPSAKQRRQTRARPSWLRPNARKPCRFFRLPVSERVCDAEGRQYVGLAVAQVCAHPTISVAPDSLPEYPQVASQLVSARSNRGVAARILAASSGGRPRSCRAVGQKPASDRKPVDDEMHSAAGQQQAAAALGEQRSRATTSAIDATWASETTSSPSAYETLKLAITACHPSAIKGASFSLPAHAAPASTPNSTPG